MKNFPTRATGKCFICGKSTKLLIHQQCGVGRERRKRRLKKYSEGAITYVLKGLAE